MPTTHNETFETHRSLSGGSRMVSALELDWPTLEDQTQPKRTRYRFADVQHLMRKVGFDAFRSINGPDDLWELREEDGTKYLYAVYDEAVDLTSTSANDTVWKATADRDGKNVSLSFKNIPLVRFASVEHGFEPAEAEGFANFLQEKAQDSEWVAKLASALPDAKRELLVSLLTEGSQTK